MERNPDDDGRDDAEGCGWIMWVVAALLLLNIFARYFMMGR